MKFLNEREGKLKWEIGTNHTLANIDTESLETLQQVFVRFKGLYEGMFYGFYRMDNPDDYRDLDECLGDEAYEAVNLIAMAYQDAVDNSGY